MAGQPVAPQLIAENDLTDQDRSQIRALLTAAFADYAELWIDNDSWGGPLEHRLLLRDTNDRLVGHLGFAKRLIDVASQSVLIAGIGTVAILPDMQGQGLGRYLLNALRSTLRKQIPVAFGFLQCRDAVVAFYEKSGFIRIQQPVRSFDPNSRQWQTDQTATMILPIAASHGSWPQGGIVDLMGMPW